MRPVLQAMVDDAVGAIPVPRDGRDYDPDVLQKAVNDAVANIPQPGDGKSLTPDDVRPMLEQMVKEKLMKRHLNTSYRLVWNHITGTLVVASELARSRGKRAGVAVALSLAAVTSVPALAADKVVQAGETVNDGTLTNHDNQIVLGTANGMTISTGLEYGPDNEANTGGQWIQNGGIANNTTVTGGGLQRVNGFDV